MARGIVLTPAQHGRCRAATLGAEHVVPLQDLVEHDAIDEAAEANAEEQRRQERWSTAVSQARSSPSSRRRARGWTRRDQRATSWRGEKCSSDSPSREIPKGATIVLPRSRPRRTAVAKGVMDLSP